MRCVVRTYTLVATLAALASPACKRSPPPDDAGAITTGSLPADQASQVLARVGDHIITAGEFAAALEQMDQFDRLRYQAPERRRELLQEMIDVLVLADEAREAGADQDPVAQQEMREILRDALLRKVRDDAPAPGDVAAEEVRAYYEAHTADFHEPERRRVSAIVLPSETAALAALRSVQGDAGTSAWSDAVRSRSMDPGAKAAVADFAGDLGFVSPPGDPRGTNPRIPDEVRAAAFELAQPGDVAPKPIRASSQFYVVKLTSKTEGHDRSLEDAERTIRVKLAQDTIRAKEDALVDALRREYPVQIDEAALGQVKVDVGDAAP